MKSSMSLIVCGAMSGVLMGVANSANAVVAFDQNVTGDVIFGSGNANGFFTVDRADGVELGLRAKLRFDATNQPQNIFNSNGDGSYTFDNVSPPSGFGFAPGSIHTAIWNFEWSINSDLDGSTGRSLSDLTYLLSLDGDPSSSVDFLSFDPINVHSGILPDHAIGDNATGNGAGVTAASVSEYDILINSRNLAQNSWNYEFFDGPGNPLEFFNGEARGEYVISLAAFDGGLKIAETSITVNVVPHPATTWLLLAGLGGLGAVAMRRRPR